MPANINLLLLLCLCRHHRCHPPAILSPNSFPTPLNNTINMIAMRPFLVNNNGMISPLCRGCRPMRLLVVVDPRHPISPTSLPTLQIDDIEVGRGVRDNGHISLLLPRLPPNYSSLRGQECIGVVIAKGKVTRQSGAGRHRRCCHVGQGCLFVWYRTYYILRFVQWCAMLMSHCESL